MSDKDGYPRRTFLAGTALGALDVLDLLWNHISAENVEALARSEPLCGCEIRTGS